MQDNAEKIFSREVELEKVNLGVPEISKLANLLKFRGINIKSTTSVEELKNNIIELVKIKNE